MNTLACCQDHILTENVWFVWSETSYSGDERRCHGCGTTERQTTISEDRATQPMEAGGWVSQWEESFNSISFLCKAASDSSGMLVPVKDEEDKPTKIETPRENHHRKCCNNAQSRLVFWENNLHGIDQGIDEAIGSHQSLQRKCN